MTILVNFRHLPQTNRPKLQFLRSIKLHLPPYLLHQGVHLPLSVAVAHLYTTFPDTLPDTQEDITALCGTIVTLLGSLVVPTKAEHITSFRRDTDKLCCVLPLLWNKSRNKEECLETLNCVYTLISDTQDTDPCMCLVSVIEHVPQVNLAQASTIILSQSSSEVAWYIVLVGIIV